LAIKLFLILINRKKPLAEPDSGRVADQLGFEKTEKKGQQTPFKGYLLRQENTS